MLVAFSTRATNLADHVTGPVQPPGGEELVWLRDVTAGTTTLVSRAGAAGAPANRFAAQPSIDITLGGPVVAFISGASNLGGGRRRRVPAHRQRRHDPDRLLPQPRLRRSRPR